MQYCLNRHQQISRAVVNAAKFSYTITTPILKSQQWLKIKKRIEYELLSLLHTKFLLLYSTCLSAYVWTL